MAAPNLFKPADYDWEPKDLEDAQRRPLFKRVEIRWGKPSLWNKGNGAPIGTGQKKACLYIITREHHRANYRERIIYVGVASDPRSRFRNHPKAGEILATTGDVRLSIGTVDFKLFRAASTKPKRFLEELEHLFIWALWSECMENERKAYTIPGLGKNGGHAWHVHNMGHRFAGQMPLEIVYPWMLVKSGRNRSLKNESAK